MVTLWVIEPEEALLERPISSHPKGQSNILKAIRIRLRILRLYPMGRLRRSMIVTCLQGVKWTLRADDLHGNHSLDAY